MKKRKEGEGGSGPKNSHEDEPTAASPVLSWAVKHFIHFFFPQRKEAFRRKASQMIV